jgi:UDPglucose--hexose-1-phosphate uridylyltransferase
MNSELRSDPVTGRTVIIARGRSERPQDFARATTIRSHATCPFCRGNERETPQALAAYAVGGAAGEDDWLVRVIPNKYPALSFDAAPPTSLSDAEYAPTTGAGYGAHEVIIESPRHVTCFSRLDLVETQLALRAYRDRLLVHRDKKSLRYGQIFKNNGADGGATIGHVHSQLIATPFLPREVSAELAGCRRYFESHDRCIYCEMIDRETTLAQRTIAETERFIAFCPFAARFPYETWLLPRRHASQFHALDDIALAELAPLLRSLVAATIAASGQDAYNFLIHTAPFDTSATDHYHWHIELFPRMLEVGGFEWGTGCHINPVPPEDAAPQLRTMAQSFWDRKTS